MNEYYIYKIPYYKAVLGLILFQKITGKRRKRSIEDSIDHWDMLENMEILAIHGNSIFLLKYLTLIL